MSNIELSKWMVTAVNGPIIITLPNDVPVGTVFAIYNTSVESLPVIVNTPDTVKFNLPYENDSVVFTSIRSDLGIVKGKNKVKCGRATRVYRIAKEQSVMYKRSPVIHNKPLAVNEGDVMYPERDYIELTFNGDTFIPVI